MKNSIYWAYNVPLQIWPEYEEGKDSEDPDATVVDYRVVNYMARKEGIGDFMLSEVLDEQSREEFLESAALHLENLARQFREAIQDPKKYIYYADDGMKK